MIYCSACGSEACTVGPECACGMRAQEAERMQAAHERLMALLAAIEGKTGMTLRGQPVQVVRILNGILVPQG